MPTNFFTVTDNATTTTTGFTAGATLINLATGTGSLFGSPSAANPVLITTATADRTTVYGLYSATGRTGDTLTGLTLLAGTDTTLPTGYAVEGRWTSEHVSQITTAINAIEADYLTSTSAVARAAFVQTADKTVSNTTTVTSLVGTGIGSATIGAGTAGKAYRLRAHGAFNSIATPGTINLQLFLGSTRVAVTSAVTLQASQTGRYWDADFDLTVRAIGASGSVYASGKGLFSTTATIAATPAATAIDTTGALAIDLRAGFSIADPGNAITCAALTIEALN